MAGMTESCSVCNTAFEMQFRYQMEEREGGFLFFCSQACHGKLARGETTSGVVCDACGKRFVVELVSQMLKTNAGRKYACSDDCRSQVLAEVAGVRLAAFAAQEGANTVIPESEPAPRVAAAAGATEGPGRAPATAARTAPIRSDVAPRRIAGPKRLAIFNHKGGTGKTTTSVSLAAGLAARGLRVLLVDTDSQGNVSVSLGMQGERSLYHVLVMGIRPQSAIVTVRPNLDLIGANETLAAAELYLAGRQTRDRVLKDRLASVNDLYDVVLVDCSPSLSLMNQNALVYADGILVPVACDFLSLVGVRQVIKTVKNVNSLLHHPVQIHGVLPTFYDGRARICRDAVETLKDHFGDRCLVPIRSTTKVKEAPSQGKTLFEYAPESHAAQDYMRIVDHLITGAPASATTDTLAAQAAG